MTDILLTLATVALAACGLASITRDHRLQDRCVADGGVVEHHYQPATHRDDWQCAGAETEVE